MTEQLPSNQPTLWARILEHKVLQWGLAYLGAGLALAHGQELVAHAFHWPELVGRVLIGALIVGFPVALALAWYHGHKGLTGISKGELTIVSLLLLLGAGVLVLFVHVPEEPGAVAASHTGTPVSEKRPAVAAPNASVAVLPFKDMSPGKDQEYFADGVAEEILNSLARIQDLRVTGRTSSFAFKGKDEDLRTIGEMLRVKNILEGSVRKDRNQLRITVQLNDAATGYHVWSKSYDRPLEGVFAIQEDIARSVAQALEVSLGVGELGHRPGMTRNVEAFDAYLTAMAFDEPTPNALRGARERYERAVALDPSFVAAWIGLANVYAFSSVAHVTGDTAEGWARKADGAIEQVRRIAPDAPDFHLLLSDRSMNAWAWGESERQYESALSAARKLGRALPFPDGGGLRLLLTGRFQQAITGLEATRITDPLNSFVAFLLAESYADAGDLASAIAEQDRGLRLEGSQSILRLSALLTALASKDRALIDRRMALAVKAEANQGLATFLQARLDRPADALAELRRRASTATDLNQLSSLAVWMAYFGAPNDALEIYLTHLDLFRSARRNGMLFDIWRPVMRDVRRQPGFKRLVREMGLVDFWRASGWAQPCKPVGTDDFECS